MNHREGESISRRQGGGSAQVCGTRFTLIPICVELGSAEQQRVNELRLVSDVPSVPGEYSPHRAGRSATPNCPSDAAQSDPGTFGSRDSSTTLGGLRQQQQQQQQPTVRRTLTRDGVYRAMPKPARALCQRRRRG